MAVAVWVPGVVRGNGRGGVMVSARNGTCAGAVAATGSGSARQGCGAGASTVAVTEAGAAAVDDADVSVDASVGGFEACSSSAGSGSEVRLRSGFDQTSPVGIGLLGRRSAIEFTVRESVEREDCAGMRACTSAAAARLRRCAPIDEPSEEL